MPSTGRCSTSLTFSTLYPLQRLKARFPAAKGSSGHRLFISAFVLASKIVCDDTHSNRSWCIVGQGMFALREINQMEREMCSYLEWQLDVDPSTLRDFQARVQQDVAGPGPLALTSPASLVSPQTPPDAHGQGFVKVVSADSSPVETHVIPHGHGTASTLLKPAKPVVSTAPSSFGCGPPKTKVRARPIRLRDAGCLVNSGDLWCILLSSTPHLSLLPS
jgi:hypothetical protein